MKKIITGALVAVTAVTAVAALSACGGVNGASNAIATAAAPVTTTTIVTATTTTMTTASATTTTTAAPATSATTKEAPAPPEYTVAQQNAIESAQSYLEMTAFSRAGLIQQLSSEYGEKFAMADAVFAVNHIEVDWNAEAVESAKSHI